jgi:hypothetical protein
MPEKHLLQAKYPDLQKSASVELSAAQHRRRGENVPNDPVPKLEAWLSDLEQIHTGRGASPERQEAQPQVIERIKKVYHRDYITGTDDASVMRKLQRDAKIAENQGHGMAEDIMQRVNDAVIEQTRETIQHDQERSLDSWVDYLASEDATYPMWFKYYVFRNITKLSSFDKENSEFPKRSKSTTASFPDINREALAYMQDSLAKHYGFKNLDPNNPEAEIDQQTKVLLDKEANFASLFKRCIEYAAPKTAENLNVTDGEWVKFDQTDDPEQGKKLANSLHGYGTGWCTAGEGTAQSQLAGGDFHVYYTKSEDGQYSVPRVAIRMESGSIAEVRGIEADQNLEGALLPIAEAKMNEADPEGAEAYKKKTEDMQRVTEIYARQQERSELTDADLRFIYELDGPIQGFGYTEDPRIEHIRHGRNIKADLSSLLDLPQEQISLTKDEALSGGVVYHYGDLDLRSLTSTLGLNLPEFVGGDLDLSSLTSAEGLTFPTSVGGSLDLRSLTSAEGLTFPTSVGGELILFNLTSAEGITLPQIVGGGLSLRSLTSAKDLALPQSVGGNLTLYSLTSAEGLTFPQSLDGNIDLSVLTSAEGLTLPQSVGGDLSLSNLTSAEGLTLPYSVGGNLILKNLTSDKGLTLPTSVGGSLNLGYLASAEGLTLPESVGGDLFLDHLIIAESFILPQSVGGSIDLRSLTSAERLTFPISVGGELNLRSLISAEGLTLPESVGSNLNLHSLSSAEGLALPQSVGGDLDLRSLYSDEGLTLPQSVGGYLDLNSLTSAEGLTLPESVGGNLNLHSLSSAEGLTLPQSVGGNLILNSLTSAEGLTLPQSIGGYLNFNSLISAEGLTLPQSIGGDLYLRCLTSAEGLTLPQSIGGGLNLNSLTSAERNQIRAQRPDLAVKIFPKD